MDIADLLASVQPSNTSGALAKDRLDFQGHWAITLLLDEYKASADPFVILFDYHDDVVLLKNDKAYFYQVKTSTTESSWTEKKLTGTYKKYFFTIYEHLINFAKNTESLCMVSNIPFEINHALVQDGHLKSFAQDSINKLTESIKKHHQLAEIDKRFIEIMSFKVTPLSLDGDDAHIEGIFAEFIREVAPDSDIDPYVVLGGLCRYIAKRNNFDNITLTGKELKSKKGISREAFSALIKQINEVRMRDAIRELKNILNSESELTLKEKDDIERQFVIVYNELLSGNRFTLTLHKTLIPITDNIYAHSPTCFALLQDVLTEAANSAVFSGLSDAYMYALIFFSYLCVKRETK